MSASTTPRLFPVQVRHPHNRAPGAVCEPLYMRAYEVYCALYGKQDAMVDFEKGCRGGFSTGELMAFLYARTFPKNEWRARVDEAFAGLST